MRKEKMGKKKGGKKKWFIIAAAVVIIGAAAAGGGNSGNTSDTGNATAAVSESQTDTTPEYENVSNDEYARDGQKCISYRVAVAADLSDDELSAVFNDLCADDDYYLHTVYFYSDKELADGGDAYDVAMLEETASGSDPVITRK